MLIKVVQFGGIAPKVKDPVLLPEGKSQAALNCRFDQGGVMPLMENELVKTPTHSGTLLTIFPYYNPDDDILYFFAWTSDVDATKAPVPGDAYGRVFYTEGGTFKVTDKDLFDYGGSTNYPASYRYPSPPAPASAPSVSGTPSGSDPTLIETRTYVYTYVNGYGAEGPPSPPSNLLDIYDGNAVSITGLASYGGGDAALYDLQKKRIYRTNQNASGGAEYQFVAEINYSTTTYSDTVYDASLGEVLPSLTWDAPPAGIKGLIALPNGSLAGFVGNLLCLSVPNFPHAWPAEYQKPTERDIVGLGAYGMTVAALTEGQPYVATGSHPSNYVMARLDGGLACLSKTSIVVIWSLGMTIYACPEGLMAVSANGPPQLLTKRIITPEQWMAKYNPSTIKGYYWQGKYVGFFTNGVQRAGFIFDPATEDLIDLDFFATAGCWDTTNGLLYVLQQSNINSFGGGDAARNMTWVSKQYRFPPAVLKVMKVLSDEYPVTVDITHWVTRKKGGVMEPMTVSVRNTVRSKQPQRINPGPGITDTIDVRIVGKTNVSAIFLSSTFEEMSV